jgi:hypothetical protein
VPKNKAEEADLIEALKTTARRRIFFSSAKEPFIGMDFLKFTRMLDRALIQCGSQAGCAHAPRRV